MMTTQQQLSATQLKQRKFLTVLPALVLPFLTFFFWFFGGGQVREIQAMDGLTGINSDIPLAVVKDQPSDKLRYYEQADKDSAKLAEQQRNDPYYNSFMSEQEYEGYEDEAYSPYSAGNLNTTMNPIGYDDAPENKVLEKLAQLNAVLEPSQTDTVLQASASYPLSRDESLSTSGDIDRLQQMMAMMQQGSGEDAEMGQINSMLETILDIQHPERVQDRLKKTSEEKKGQVFPVSATGDNNVVTTLQRDVQREHLQTVTASSGNGFYAMEEDDGVTAGQNAIEAVIHEKQTLTTGATVKLRLINDVYINGKRIPKDNFVFGTASLNGERLEISIDHIRNGSSLFPVSLNVHDLDGLEGVYIPGAITRDVMKQSGDQSLQGMGMMTMSPSIGVQAASAGIELGKNLLSKKIRLVKVQVKAGYKVLLMDQNQKRNNS